MRQGESMANEKERNREIGWFLGLLVSPGAVFDPSKMFIFEKQLRTISLSWRFPSCQDRTTGHFASTIQ
jgi:hypothetical protein